MAKKKTGPDLREQLLEAIEKSPLTKYRIARLARIDAGTISRFTAAKRDLQFETVVRLADALGLEFTKRK